MHLCETLEKDFHTNYLLGLRGFTDDQKKLDVFSLNYDSVIETFCEQNNIEYTDGFNLYWNPDSFNEGRGINLYKLHGSLYWFKTGKGKLIKIPLKNLSCDKEKMFYYTGEEISETIIYPATLRNLKRHLSHIFERSLNKSYFKMTS